MDIITIVGPRAAGKSTIGKALAKKTGYKFIEMDRLMDAELNGKSLEYMFTKGTNEYMKVFHRILKGVLKQYKNKKIVIEGGYGQIHSENDESKHIAKTFQESSKIVLIVPEKDIEASTDILFKRERKRKMWDHFNDVELRDKIRKDLLERISGMEKIAHETVHVEGRSQEEVSTEICKLFL